jgi:hypothetical protein
MAKMRLELVINKRFNQFKSIFTSGRQKSSKETGEYAGIKGRPGVEKRCDIVR